MAASPVDSDPEALRLAALQSYGVLDTPPEAAFDDVVALACRVCETPIGMVSFVDENRQWFKARIGIEAPETPREISFCQTVVESGSSLVVRDALQDPRFASSPLVIGHPGIRFYAGAALVTGEGLRLGSLCVCDTVPRDLDAEQLVLLEGLARQVMESLELRRLARENPRQAAESGQLQVELNRLKARLAVAQRIAGVGSWELDLRTGRLWWSDELYKLFGVDREQFGGTFETFLACVHSEDRPGILGARDAVLAGGTALNNEHRVVRRGGEIRYVQERGELIRDEQDQPIRIAGTTLDVTERKLTEIKLAEGENRYRLLFDNNPASMWVYDLETLRILAVNDATLRELGYSRDEFMRMTMIELRPPEEVPRLLEYLRGKLSRIQHAGIWRYRRRDGSLFPMEIISHEIEFAGHPARLVLALNVTDRLAAEAALRSSQERMALVIEAANLGYWDWDVRNDHIVMNARAAEMAGYTLDEVEPSLRFWAEHVHPEDWPEVQQVMEDHLSGRTPSYQTEHRIRTKSGDWKWVLQAGRVTEHSPDGSSLRATGIQLDIDAAKRAGEQLRRLNEDLEDRVRQRTMELAELEALYHTLAESAPQIIWAADTAGRMTYLNQAWVRLTGCEAKDSLGTRWMKAVHPDDGADLASQWEQGFLSGEAISGEFQLRRNDGTYATVDNVGRPVRDVTGKILQWVGTCTDISGRKQAEAARQRLLNELEVRVEERTREVRENATLLDAANDAILVFDLDRRIQYWNAGAARVLGWSAEEVIGKDLGDWLFRDLNGVRQAIDAVLRTGAWAGELHPISKERRTLTIECSWTLVKSGDGGGSRVLAINTDITERKQLEAQFLRAQRMESIGVLAGGIAHDLNNMLSPILMAIALLNAKIRDESDRELVTMIERSARRGADLVRQVLSFARGVEGARIEVQPAHLIKDVVKIAHDTFPRSIQILMDVPRDLWLVAGDPTQLHQVMLNLCVNARDAMPNGGELRVAATNVSLDKQYSAMAENVSPGTYVCIEVVDTGVGMSEEVRARIFEPFYTTKEVGKGTGLGLSTTLAIVKSHNGFINVYSEPGRGSTFRVYLPAYERTALVEEPTETQELPRGNGETVLLVDDEASILSISTQTLQAFGYRVLTARDGVEAVATYAAQQAEISVVVTDIMMPIMDGIAAIRALKHLNPEVRIIAASGLGSNDDAAKAASTGIKHFVHKPYTADTLLVAVHDIIHS